MKTQLEHLALIVMVVLCASAKGQSTLLSTLDTPFGTFWGLNTADWTTVAQEFTTGSQSENVGSVSVNIVVTSDGNNFTVSFYNNISDAPGSLLSNGLLSGPGTPTADSINYYNASGLTLAANTTYWLVFDNSSAIDLGLGCASGGDAGLATSSSAGWSLGDLAYGSSGTYTLLNNQWTPLFSVSDSNVSVPEPATLALAGLSGLGLLLFRRK
jgi:hypothetical protein